MKTSAKLIDDGVICVENVQDFLQENNDFLAVGIVGPQSVGKSTILNLLAHNKVTEELKQEIFKQYEFHEDDGLDNVKVLTDDMLHSMLNNAAEKDRNCLPFLQQKPKDVEANVNATYGIDFYITENRVRIF